jgi:uncharacterized protein YqeY
MSSLLLHRILRERCPSPPAVRPQNCYALQEQARPKHNPRTASRDNKRLQDGQTHHYSLIQKQIKSSQVSIDEFRNAKREELVEKEQQQLDVLKAYAEEIPTVAESEVDALVKTVLEGLEEGKRSFGSVMGKVMGVIKGRPFDAEYVTKKIQEAVGAK